MCITKLFSISAGVTIGWSGSSAGLQEWEEDANEAVLSEWNAEFLMTGNLKDELAIPSAESLAVGQAPHRSLPRTVPDSEPEVAIVTADEIGDIS